MLSGVDISSFQGAHPPLTRNSIVFIKATEALGYTNPYLAAQVALARSLGCRVGFYHYGWPTNSAAAEARFFASVVSHYIQPGDLTCLDWEFYGPSGQGVNNTMANKYKDDWFATIATIYPQHRNILYTNRDRWINVDSNSNCGEGLWIADYVTKGQPRVQYPWIGHQWSDGSPSPAPIDQDVWRFDTLADWDKWAMAKVPAVKPTAVVVPTSTQGDTVMASNDANDIQVQIGVDDQGKPVYWTLSHVLGNLREANTETQTMLKGVLATLTLLSNKSGLDPQVLQDAVTKAIESSNFEVAGVNLQAAPTTTNTTGGTVQ